MSHRALYRAITAALASLAAIGSVGELPRAHAAGRPAVSIGDITVSADAGANSESVPELNRALRSALSEELSRVSGLGTVKRPLIVSATLTRISSEHLQEHTKATATISIALSRADDRVLFAELSGRASVEEASGNPSQLRRAALQGAVHGAVSRLPEAVRRAP